jgi:hypothetical protein
MFSLGIARQTSSTVDRNNSLRCFLKSKAKLRELFASFSAANRVARCKFGLANRVSRENRFSASRDMSKWIMRGLRNAADRSGRHKNNCAAVIDRSPFHGLCIPRFPARRKEIGARNRFPHYQRSPICSPDTFPAYSSVNRRAAIAEFASNASAAPRAARDGA